MAATLPAAVSWLVGRTAMDQNGQEQKSSVVDTIFTRNTQQTGSLFSKTTRRFFVAPGTPSKKRPRFQGRIHTYGVPAASFGEVLS